MRIIDITHPPQSLWIGREGENTFRPVSFECANWFSAYPDATIVAYYQPYGASDPYPLVLTVDGTKRIWHPLLAELVKGDGELQIVLMNGDTVGTSAIIPTKVDRSLISSADHPASEAPSWAVEVVRDVEEAASHYPKIVNDYWWVWDVQTETWVNTGVKATGEGGGTAADAVLYTPQTLTDAQKAQARTNVGAGTYSKPSGGIPASDLASDVQTSLGKADTALQQHQSLAGYATESYVQTQIAAIPDELPSDTASGAIASFPDGADDAPVKSLVAQIAPVQSGSGDPSPTNIRPISGWTSATVTRTGADNQSDTYTIAFPAEAGTVYGGTLDVTNGVLTVDSAIVDMGTLNWMYYPNQQRMAAQVNSAKPAAANVGLDGACSVYKVVNTGYRYMPDKSILIGNNFISNQYAAMVVHDSDYTDAATFKTAVSGQTLVFPIKNPVTYQLTPTEVTTLLGTNNIQADTGDVAVDYRADTGLYIQKLTGALQTKSITDTGGYYTTDTVDGALQEIGGKLLPSGGSTGDFLRKTASGVAWQTVPSAESNSFGGGA